MASDDPQGNPGGMPDPTMGHLTRAVRRVFCYPWTLTAAITSSFVVALLWSANIGAAYPVLEVTLSGKSLSDWVDSEVARAEGAISEIDKTIAEQQAALPDADPETAAAIAEELVLLESRRAAEENALEKHRSYQPLIRKYTPSTPFETVLIVLSVLLVVMLAKGFLEVLNAALTARLIHRVATDLRRQFFAHVMRMDPRTFDKRGTSILVTHMDGDINTITDGVAGLFGVVREPLKMAACIIGAIVINWRLTLATFLIAPVAGFFISLLAKKIRGESARSMQHDANLNRVAFESFNGLKTVQAFTMQPAETERFRGGSESLYRKIIKISFFNSLSKPISEVLGFFMTMTALLMGAYLVLNEQTHIFGIRMCERPISLATLLVFFGMLMGMNSPARKLSEIYSQIQIGCAAACRVFTVLDEEALIADPPEPRQLPSANCELRFEGVEFYYSESQPVLRDFNLTIAPGETVAIIGPNGSGKSTMLNLALRFYDPVAGRITLGDVDLREASLQELRNKFGIVTQQALLFDDTVYNNIQYGSPDATELEIIQAAKRARAHEFIVNDLAEGYQTVVGQNGDRISGGQRQRVAMARAILRDPEILIFDEATSQIDVQSEFLIHEAIKEFVEDRTTIIVTHRSSTLTLADRIVVINEGRIVDVGTNEELSQRCEFYHWLTSDATRLAG